MNQISPENCQIQWNKRWKVNKTQRCGLRLGKPRAGGTMGKFPPLPGVIAGKFFALSRGYGRSRVLWELIPTLPFWLRSRIHGCILHVLVPWRASPGTCSSGQTPDGFLAEMCCWGFGSRLWAAESLQNAPSCMLEISYCNPLTLQKRGTSDPDPLPRVHREGLGAQGELR